MEVAPNKWDQDTCYALGLYKRVTRIVGIWPLDGHRIFSVLKVFFIIIIQMILVAIFGRNWILKGSCGTITEIVDAVSLMTTSSMAVLKILLSTIYYEEIRYIVETAVNDWRQIKNRKSRKVMLQYAYIGRIVFIIQMFGAYMTIFPLILTRLPNSIVVDDLYNRSMILRNIPIGPRCWVSLEISTPLYLFYYVFVCIHLFILATAYLGGDVFIFGLAMHVCGQFELLYNSMKELDDKMSYKHQRKKLLEFLNRHTHLLKLTNKFEEAFNMLIFFELCANTLIISISEIILIWACRVRNTEIMMAMIVRIYLMYVQIFMYSFIGEQLSSRAKNLQVAIYNCRWYNMSPKIVKDLKFIMMRNNYKFHLTAGKICDMNHESFKNIVKSMFSCFSILRLMFAD